MDYCRGINQTDWTYKYISKTHPFSATWIKFKWTQCSSSSSENDSGLIHKTLIQYHFYEHRYFSNSCYYSWSHVSAAFLKGARKRGYRVNMKDFYITNVELLDKISSPSVNCAYFTQEEKMQLLNGSCPRHLTNSKLKAWLPYHVGAAKDGSALTDASKRKLIHR